MTVEEFQPSTLMAIYYVRNPDALKSFAEKQRLDFRKINSKVFELFVEATDTDYAEYDRRMSGEDEVQEWNGWRPDAIALTRFVKAKAPLTARMVHVFTLCIERGLSLNACAARLGIKRETVRSHLRRLRELARRFHAFDDMQPLAWELVRCEPGITPEPTVIEIVSPAPASIQDASADACFESADGVVDVLRQLFVEIHHEVADVRVGREDLTADVRVAIRDDAIHVS
jgi:hypothetical protein